MMVKFKWLNSYISHFILPYSGMASQTIHGMYAIHVNMHHDYADNDIQLNFVEENVIMLHVNINEFQVNITI